jgi:GntR family transcriptional regulator
LQGQGAESVLDEGAPIFSQIAERLVAEIADGTLAEGERAPSTTELSTFYRINPATAAKGINVLIDDELLEKRRGIGMFVAPGARERLLNQRRHDFAKRYIDPMVIEATRLEIGEDALVTLIRESRYANGGITV